MPTKQNQSSRIEENISLDKDTLVVILYLIERLNGVLGKTHLQKMLFLSDLLSFKKFKKPITHLKFEKNHYGPYCSDVDSYVTHLEAKHLVEKRELPIFEGEKTYFRFYFKGKDTTKKILFDRIGPDKVVLLDDIISSYGNISLQEVLDVVYSLETIKKSEQHTPLEMAKIIKDDNKEVNEIDIF
jgi:hypothetical protein